MSNDMKLIMESWRREVLNEIQWREKVTSDNDWPAGSNNGIIFFDLKSKYNKEGGTHDVNSHAIKHGKDSGFGADLQKALQTFKKLLIKYINGGNKVYYNLKGDVKELKSNEVDQVNDKFFRNTLDRIYDDMVNGKNVLPIEKQTLSLLKPIKDKYVQASLQVLDNPNAKYDNDGKKVFIKNKQLTIVDGGEITSSWGDKKFKKDPERWVKHYSQRK